VRETLPQVMAGTASRVPQDKSQATLAPRLTKADGLIDWQQDAAPFRAASGPSRPGPAPQPPSAASAFIIRKARVVADRAGEPGTILELPAEAGRGPVVARGLAH